MELTKAAAALEIRPARRNVWLLSLGHAVKMSQSALIAAVRELIGGRMPPDPSLATLPASLQYPAIMFVTIPAAMWLSRYGAKVIL